MTARMTSKDSSGVPVNFHWPYRMDLRFSLTLIIPEGSEYTLVGKTITFIIKEKDALSGVYLVEQGLTDGTITVEGNTITGDIPFLVMDTAGVVEGLEYEYGITIGEPIDGNRVQGRFYAVPETGQVPQGSNNFLVEFGDFTAELYTVTGPPGPPGEGSEDIEQYQKRRNFEVVMVTAASYAALVTDQVIVLDSSTNDVALTLPETENLRLFIRHDHNSENDNVATVTNTINGEAGPHIVPKGNFFPMTYDGSDWITEQQ